MKVNELKIWYLVKNCKGEIENDFIWTTLKLDNYQIKIVKNLLYNQLCYAGFNVSGDSIDRVEIYKFYNDEYGNIKCLTSEYRDTEKALRIIESILYDGLSFYRKLIYGQIDNIIKVGLFIDGLKRAIFGYKVRNPLIAFRLAKNFMDNSFIYM